MNTTHQHPDQIRATLIPIIETAITHQPRSLQRTIGPSEIGMPCDHCLAAKLAGWEQHNDPAWLPFIGTAVHAELERIFTPNPRFEVEQHVTITTPNGDTITGTCDLFDTHTGTVTDWKIVGPSTLARAKHGPTPQYRVQAHAYGQGWANRGHTVTTVSIAYLPRNATTLRQAVIWSEPYNPVVVTDALTRVTQYQNTIALLDTPDRTHINQWISGLDRADGCFTCPRYPDWQPAPSRLHTYTTN